MTTKRIAISTFATFVAMVGGALFGAAFARVWAGPQHSGTSGTMLEAAIVGGTFLAGVGLGFVGRSLGVKIWPGLFVVALLLAGVAAVAFPNNPWQVAHAVVLLVLPLALGVSARVVFPARRHSHQSVR